mmetsp:Transcript_77638/g.219525  ORF Transcript_77638/g.219525 Transcript_77638/m.219525 type:complete len:110 (+) Transcript_77638:68-397(+)
MPSRKLPPRRPGGAIITGWMAKPGCSGEPPGIASMPPAPAMPQAPQGPQAGAGGFGGGAGAAPNCIVIGLKSFHGDTCRDAAEGAHAAGGGAGAADGADAAAEARAAAG